MTEETRRRIEDLSGNDARELLLKLAEMASDPDYDHADLGDDLRITLAESGLLDDVDLVDDEAGNRRGDPVMATAGSI